ncbi:MAG TPA: carboxypeptidase regulatory-like domain-containing protein [Gemmatimonadaceae bacterium]
MLNGNRLGSLVGLCLLLFPLLAAAQGTTEIVRGRVRATDAEPVEDAIVTVTGLQTNAVRVTRTNDKGVYTVLFADGEGEYVISVRAIGYAPGTARATRLSDANVLVADVTLAAVAAQLDTVTVVGRRLRLGRGNDRSIGGNEQSVSGGALFSLDPSDLRSLVANVPGIMYLPGANGAAGAFSVLGASPDQNNILVDGSTFAGSSLPQDAIGSAQLATTTFDPARGHFAGGELSIRTRGGSDVFGADVHGTLADPRLAWADPASLTPLSRDYSLGGSAGGPIRKGKLYYFGAFDMSRTSSDQFSLLSPREALLTQYGLSPDTIAELAAQLDSLHIPLTTGAIPRTTGNNRYSAFARFDATPSATTSFSVHASGDLSSHDGTGISTLGFPSLGSGSRSSRIGVQVSASAYRGGFLDELTTSLNRSSSSSDPYIALPNGSVRVGVQYADGSDGLTSLYFGGGTSGSSESKATTWETSNELSWLTSDSRHRLKFGQGVTYAWNSSRDVANPFGMFTFQSLDDLKANRPSSYSRILSSRTRSTSAVSGSLWLGDEWRPSNSFQLETGARLDVARSGTEPAYNPTVNALFGVRTDRIPRDVGISPRIGFSWTPGASTSDVILRPPISISGGFGAFRGVIQPDRIASLVDATGLPNTVRQLVCVGDATPIPNWRSYGVDNDAIPSTCLDGQAPVEFSTEQPTVMVFDSTFRAPLSWRGNLQVSGLSLAGWQLRVGGTYSLGVNGESNIDLNLHRSPEFTLPNEDDRPVFVAPSNIVPSSGAIAPGASRNTDQYGRVMSIVSDLHSQTAQFSLSLAPTRPLFGKVPLFVSYTFTKSRMQSRGFDGTTAGDPFAREWTSGQQPVHNIILNASFRLTWLSFRLLTNITSGMPYTPIVAGDVNGDGLSNDRAFVFDPTSSSDPLLGSQMAELLAAAPERVRGCLTRQIGHIAGRNSCHTGWRVRPDVNVAVNPQHENLPFVGDRLHLSLNTVNAMGALLRVLGLSGTALGRAAAGDGADPVLLYVDGFDPATRRYQYRVNQQFGETRDRTVGGRRFSAPFQVQLRAELFFGGPSHSSLAQELGLVAKDGEKPLTSEQVKARLRSLTSNPLAQLLMLRDSLLLTAKQIQDIQQLSNGFEAHADSTLTPLARYLAEHGKHVNDDDLGKRLASVQSRVRDLMLDALREASELLMPTQKERLPEYLRDALAAGTQR